MPGVQRVRHAADGPALAGGVLALEYQDQRSLLEFVGPGRAGQPSLEQAQFGLVVLLVHLGFVVQLAQAVDDTRGTGMRHESRRNAGNAALAHRGEHRFGRARGPHVFVGAGDHHPGRMAAIRVVQDDMPARADAVEPLVDLEVDGADLPGGLRAGQQALRAGLLGLGGQVEPELDDLHALGRQHGFEAHDCGGLGLDGFRIRLLACRFDDQRRVPGAEDDAGAALGRQVVPVAPERRAVQFVAFARAIGERPDMARIHPFVEQVDGGALAGAVDPRHDHQQRFLCLPEALVLRFQQGDPQPFFERLELVFGQDGVGFGFGEHGDARIGWDFDRAILRDMAVARKCCAPAIHSVSTGILR
ncbi:hypothetical protein D3C72_915790 [compost metagenome]